MLLCSFQKKSKSQYIELIHVNLYIFNMLKFIALWSFDMFAGIAGGVALLLLFFSWYKLYVLTSRSYLNMAFIIPSSIFVLFLTLFLYLILWDIAFTIIEFDSDYYEMYAIVSSLVMLLVSYLVSTALLYFFPEKINVSIYYLSNSLILFFILQPLYRSYNYLVHFIISKLTSGGYSL